METNLEARLSKREIWELAAPHMAYMSTLRNLRNFDQVGLSDELASQISAKIADPAQVRKSRQLPFRFYSAYKNAPSLRWGHALEVALTHSLANLPELTGRSLVLIDTSGSMQYNLSARSEMNRVTAAALFSLALALKNPELTDVFGFADGQFRVTGVERGFSVLKAVEAFTRQVGVVGMGTRIELAVRATFDPTRHDRVLIFSDMQTFPVAGQALRAMPYAEHIGDVSAAVPAHVPVYAFNLAGHEKTAMPVVPGNRRYELGGLTDHTLGQVKSLEQGLAGTWPWMVQ